MKYVIETRILAIFIILGAIALFFIATPSNADVYVNGYYRSNGTYVQGHYRSSPDSSPYNNYSYPGNYNPYTGVTAGGNPDTYLQNYYDNSGSSYYGGTSTYDSTPTYNYNTWTPTPTPSCPFMSSYDSTSGSCKCYSGYVADGGSCVSGLTYCWGKYGMNSSYSSLDKSCECDYGYELKYGTCTRKETSTFNYSSYVLPTPTPTYNGSASCQQKYGTESRYDSTTGNCVYCESGLRLIGDKCYPPTTPTPQPQVLGSTSPAKPSDFGLTEGDVIGAQANDPDIFIVSDYGYKRLFLNEAIFGFYGHLGGFSKVKNITATTRDSFKTSGLFKNCETNDPTIYAIEITGNDSGMLHKLNISGNDALSQDPDFFKKVFCINNNEFAWYPQSNADYTSLSQIPNY